MERDQLQRDPSHLGRGHADDPTHGPAAPDASGCGLLWPRRRLCRGHVVGGLLGPIGLLHVRQERLQAHPQAERELIILSQAVGHY